MSGPSNLSTHSTNSKTNPSKLIYGYQQMDSKVYMKNKRPKGSTKY
jgi:hypothetical protein